MLRDRNNIHFVQLLQSLLCNDLADRELACKFNQELDFLFLCEVAFWFIESNVLVQVLWLTRPINCDSRPEVLSTCEPVVHKAVESTRAGQDIKGLLVQLGVTHVLIEQEVLNLLERTPLENLLNRRISETLDACKRLDESCSVLANFPRNT